MTRFVAAECADQAVTQQVKVTDGIQDLVLDELVLVAQTVVVQDAVPLMIIISKF